MIGADLAFYDALTLGRNVDLHVEADVAAKAGKSKLDKEGDETVTAQATLRVTQARIVQPEDL